MDKPQITLAQLRRIFGRHRGAATELAKEIGVNKVTVSQALYGRIASDRIVLPVRKRAAELLAAEQGEAGAV